MRPSKLLRKFPPTWALVLLVVALTGGEIARRGLWEPDEARYAYVAREMRDGGHWLVPHVNGHPYPDKPPLMFWLINASSWLTGGRINGVSARLPSLLGMILSLWAVTRLLARWRYGPETAWRAVLVLLTTYMFWREGSWGRIDALLCGLVMMSVYYFFKSTDTGKARHELIAYLFAGLAVFAKGPVGLVVPMGIFITGTAAAGETRKLKRWHWLWGPGVALLIPALWLLGAWMQNPPTEYFTAMFGEKSFGRVISASGHRRPFHYYLWHFPLELLPWTLFLPAALAAPSDRILKRRLVSWMVFVIVLFSLFVCKRNVYILAVYPAAAMLIGAAWEDISRLPQRWATITGRCAMGLIWAMAAGATVALFVPQVPFSRLLLLPSALVLLGGGVALVHWFRQERLGPRWFFGFCGTLLLVQITGSSLVLPALNRLKGPVEAAQAVQARLQPDQPVYLYQQQLAIFPLYAERPGREINSVEALRKIIAERSRAIVVFKKRHWLALPPDIRKEAIPHEFPMGHKHLLWVDFSEDAGERQQDG